MPPRRTELTTVAVEARHSATAPIRWLETQLTFALEALAVAGGPPALLDEAVAAALAARATRVVLAATLQLIPVVWVRDVTHARVSVAHAPTADRNVFYRVKVLQSKYLGYY